MESLVHKRIATTLLEFGLPVPPQIIQTMLLKDRYFVGWKFRYDGGYAIQRAGSGEVELYDGQDSLLKTVALEAEREAAA
jgi:hypothetical protein